MDVTTSHTTFMRRIHEQMHPMRIIEIGTRAVCKEELEYARKSDIHLITSHQILEDGVRKTSRTIKNLLADVEKIYLTIDMDILDPAFAPGVQNPEPDGLTMNAFLNLLCEVCDHRVASLDLVEVAPNYDNGTTAIQAAKTLFETLCTIEKTKRK
jgi:agmatinase